MAGEPGGPQVPGFMFSDALGAQGTPSTESTPGPFAVASDPSHKPSASSILQKRNLKHREVKYLAWGRTAG